MASWNSGHEDGFADTNVDAVDIKIDGNLKAPGITTAPIAKFDMDEDYSVSLPLASEITCDETPQAKSDQKDYSEAKKLSLKRTPSTKRHYSRDGTAEEGTIMLAVELAEFATDGRMSGTQSVTEGHNLDDIELEVFHTNPDSTDGNPKSDGVDPDKETDGGVSGRISQIIGLKVSFLKNLSGTKLAILIAVVAGVVGIALLLGLLPASFIYIEYHELALSVNVVTGRVNRDDTYYPGCYLLTPDTGLIRFDGTAHFYFKNLQVVTLDRLSFNLGVSLQYFIKPEELGSLFSKYEHGYGQVVEAIIESAVKNAAVKFSLDSFRLNRSIVEQDFQREVSYRLSGDCCPHHCDPSINCRRCDKLPGRCYEGHHVEVRYFQLLAIEIPNDVAERFLRQTILLVEAEREVFIQEHAVETKISEKLQKDILNNATEFTEAAKTEAARIYAVAMASYEKDVQTSYFRALKRLYQRLNITNMNHKLSLMYIRALEDSVDNLYSLDFKTLTFLDRG